MGERRNRAKSETMQPLAKDPASFSDAQMVQDIERLFLQQLSCP